MCHEHKFLVQSSSDESAMALRDKIDTTLGGGLPNLPSKALILWSDNTASSVS
ncbi:hypothetical protein Pcac1_g7317 [Phytophthora cactorum]|nr:hypothetical protein Pcac1_g7317 [Phytophthora cactorum]